MLYRGKIEDVLNFYMVMTLMTIACWLQEILAVTRPQKIKKWMTGFNICSFGGFLSEKRPLSGGHSPCVHVYMEIDSLEAERS